MAEQWNEYCRGYIDRVFAVGVAQAADGGIFAGADAEGGTLEKLYKEDYSVNVVDEGGNDVPFAVSEPVLLKHAIDNMSAPQGIWIGGEKFVLVKSDPALEEGGVNLAHIFAKSKKGGAHIFKTENGYIVLGVFSEDEPYSQTQNSAYLPALEFAQWISQNL